MSEEERDLTELILAPWILRARALISVARRVGGNQFRHSMGVLAILIDYEHFSNPVLLKGSLIHDLIEDKKDTDEQELRKIDSDANEVVDLVLEVTQMEHETKEEYLQRLLDFGSPNSHILKAADRIQNLTDLNLDIYTENKVSAYLDQTETYILPMVKDLSPDMHLELKHLIEKRRKLLA